MSTENENVLYCLNEFIRTSKEIIRMLRDKTKEIEGHSNRCNAVKTVGTTASVLGGLLTVGSICLAPFTGGSSVIVAAGIGATLGVGGGVVNISTDVVDLFISKVFLKEIEDICHRRDKIALLLKNKFEEIQSISEELVKLGQTEELSLYLAFECDIIGLKKYGSTVKSIASNINNSYKLGKIAHVSRNISNFALRNGGKVWMGIRNFSNTLITVCGQFGINVTRRAGMNIAKSLTASATVFFAIWDISSLIDSWRNNHPTMTAVLELIQNIEKDLEPFVKLVSEYESRN